MEYLHTVRQRVAVVCWKSPYPTRGGLDLRVDGICKSLSAIYEVSIICMNASTNYHPNHISEIYAGPKIRNPESHEVLKWGKENPSDPFGVFADSQMVDFVRDSILRVNPDVVIVNRLMAWRLFSQAFPNSSFPKILDLDETSNRLKNAYEKVSFMGPSLKMIANFHFRNIAYELSAINDADQVLVSSELEQMDCASAVVPSKVHLIRNVVSTKKFTRTWKGPRNKVIFPGNFDYAPNKKALDFIIEEIAPQLPDFRFVIAGSGIDANRIKTTDNLNVKPFPHDMNAEFENADFLIAPLKFGAGTRLKVLEAMNSETVVIATKFAVEGLEVEPEIHYQPAETAEEFIEALRKFSKDLSKSQLMARNAKLVIDKFYTPKSIENSLAKAIFAAKR